MAAGWRHVGPMTLGSIGGKGVCSGMVDETPVAETNSSTGEVPGRTSGELVIFNGSGNFTLVGFHFHFVVICLSNGTMEEGSNGLGSGSGGVSVSNFGDVCSGAMKGKVEVPAGDTIPF